MPLHKFTNNFSLQYSVTQYTRSYKYMHTNISTIKKTAFKIYLLDHFWPAWILKNIYWGYRWGILNSIDRNSVLEYWNVGAAEKTCWIGTPFYSIWKYIEISNWFNDRTIYIYASISLVLANCHNFRRNRYDHLVKSCLPEVASKLKKIFKYFM